MFGRSDKFIEFKLTHNNKMIPAYVLKKTIYVNDIGMK